MWGPEMNPRSLRSPEPANVRADPARSSRVVLNLVLNAARRDPEGGRLTVKDVMKSTWAIIPTSCDDVEVRGGRYVALERPASRSRLIY